MQPVILTCSLDDSTTQRFVESYRRLEYPSEPPLVVIDITNSRRLSPTYLSSINSLRPRLVEIHPSERWRPAWLSVQDAAARALQLGLDQIEEGGFVLFVEDDIVFSSQFSQVLRELIVKPDTGFVTLFQPRSRYPSLVVSPRLFYGTQCILFPYKPLKDLVETWPKISHWVRMQWGFKSGYDIVWANYLASRGYKLYRTEFSCVQHIGICSRRDAECTVSTASNFVV